MARAPTTPPALTRKQTVTTTTDHPTINGHRLRLESEVTSPYEAIITAGQRYQIKRDTGRDVGNGTHIQDRALQAIYYDTLTYLETAENDNWDDGAHLLDLAANAMRRIQDNGATHYNGGADYTAEGIAEEFRAQNALAGDYARYPLPEFPIPPNERPDEPQVSPLFHPFPVTFDQARPGQEPAPMSTDTHTPVPESIDGYTTAGLRELADEWDHADDMLRDAIRVLRNLGWPQELQDHGPDLHELDNIREATYAMVAHLNELANEVEKMGTIYVEVPATLRVKWDRSAPEGARAVEAYAVVHDTNGRLYHPDGHAVDEVGQCSDWCATLRRGTIQATVVRPDSVHTHRVANF